MADDKDLNAGTDTEAGSGGADSQAHTANDDAAAAGTNTDATGAAAGTGAGVPGGSPDGRGAAPQEQAVNTDRQEAGKEAGKEGGKEGDEEGGIIDQFAGLFDR